MPYNSSSFEKQLAKYKAAQAGKMIEKTPLDPHRVQARVGDVRGKIQSNQHGYVPTSQVVGDGPQTTPVLRGDQVQDISAVSQTVIIINGKKKPLWARGWFVFLVTTVLSTAAMPVFFKDEMTQLKGLLETVKTTTGVDPLSVKTYTNMVKGTKGDPGMAPPPVAAAEPPPITDIHSVVEQAQKKAESVTAHGASSSMQYIEQETQRLNQMAKELDAEYSGKKAK